MNEQTNAPGQQTLTIHQAVDLALEHHIAGRLPEAESIYMQVLEKEPDHPVALHFLGVIAHQVGKNDIAVDLIGKALVIKPDFAEAYTNLGVVLDAQGKLDDAIASFQKALIIDPNYTKVQNYLRIAHVRNRIDKEQGGVPTFHDNHILYLYDNLNEQLPNGSADVNQYQARKHDHIQTALDRELCTISSKHQGRYVAREARSALAETKDMQKFFKPPYGDEIDSHVIVMSQGVDQCMHWKGMPIFKTVFDFSLYSMLIWDVKPKTIIEIGSGTGASAVWMADLVKAYGLETQIFSMDINKPSLKYEGVNFIQGDCNIIDQGLPSNMLAGLDHPWIVVEDAHVNVSQVVSHLSLNMITGDYMIIEDTRGSKSTDVLAWSSLSKSKFKIDTKYTDFFGRNATSSPDSIFVHI